jgi:hypothetical protein
MLSQQEMSDRFEIQDLLVRYADCIDRREFDALADVFAADAHIDYSVYGGAVGKPAEIIEFLKTALAGGFKAYQHLNANMQVQVQGDTGTGRIMCFNPQELKLGKGKTHLFMLGLWYRDKYIRTPEGWRIQERVEEKSWAFNLPEFMDFEK